MRGEGAIIQWTQIPLKETCFIYFHYFLVLQCFLQTGHWNFSIVDLKHASSYEMRVLFMCRNWMNFFKGRQFMPTTVQNQDGGKRVEPHWKVMSSWLQNIWNWNVVSISVLRRMQKVGWMRRAVIVLVTAFFLLSPSVCFRSLQGNSQPLKEHFTGRSTRAY